VKPLLPLLLFELPPKFEAPKLLLLALLFWLLVEFPPKLLKLVLLLFWLLIEFPLKLELKFEPKLLLLLFWLLLLLVAAPNANRPAVLFWLFWLFWLLLMLLLLLPNTELLDELVPKTEDVLFALLPELNIVLNCGEGCALLFAELPPKRDELPLFEVPLPKFVLVLDWKLKAPVLPF